jgi:hypothetical protein
MPGVNVSFSLSINTVTLENGYGKGKGNKMANKELQIFEWLIRNHNFFWMANREFALLYSDV